MRLIVPVTAFEAPGLPAVSQELQQCHPAARGPVRRATSEAGLATPINIRVTGRGRTTLPLP